MDFPRPRKTRIEYEAGRNHVDMFQNEAFHTPAGRAMECSTRGLVGCQSVAIVTRLADGGTRIVLGHYPAHALDEHERALRRIGTGAPANPERGARHWTGIAAPGRKSRSPGGTERLTMADPNLVARLARAVGTSLPGAPEPEQMPYEMGRFDMRPSDLEIRIPADPKQPVVCELHGGKRTIEFS